MTDWNDITEAETDPGAPGTSSLWKRWWKNPMAVAEGSAGAPVVSAGWHPYDMVEHGDGNDGLIYDHSVDGTVTTVTTPDFEDDYEYRLICESMSADNSGVTLEIDFYRELDALWAAGGTISGSIGAAEVVGVADVEIFAPMRSRRGGIARATAVTTGGNVANFAAGFYDVTVQKVLRARVSFSAGDIDAGQIYMFRRLVRA